MSILTNRIEPLEAKVAHLEQYAENVIARV